MKKTFYLTAIVALFAACNNNAQEKEATTENPLANWTIEGDTISPDDALSASDLAAKMNGNTLENVKVTGTVNSICQKKGCWMRLDAGKGEEIMVRFKDYEFFVPKGDTGKIAIIEGRAFYDTTSVEMLKHYAHDANKPQSHIDSIKKPEIQLSFEAHGVLLAK